MRKVSKGMSRQLASFVVAAVIMAGDAATTIQAKEWQAIAGAESPDRGSQALAFLPNQFWVHTGDSIRWTFPTHERHTLTFLKPGQTRPPDFGPIFGVPVGCPGVTPDGSSFDGSSCVTTGILMVPENSASAIPAPTYPVQFSSAGNFKFVFLASCGHDRSGPCSSISASRASHIPYDRHGYEPASAVACGVL